MSAMENPMDHLPRALVQAIMARLDAASICAAAASCRLLQACAMEVLPLLPVISLVDVRTEGVLVARLLAGNSSLRSLSLDCSQLDDASVDVLIKPRLETLCLFGCQNFSANLLGEIARRCTILKVLTLDLGWHEDKVETYAFSTALEQVLQRCWFLESLSLRFEGPCFDSGAYASIPRLVASSLKTLEMGFVSEREAKQVLRFDTELSCCHLEKLCMELDRITDSLMTLIPQTLSCLLELELRDEPSEEPLMAYDLTNWGVQQVGGCHSLRRLSLVRSQDCYPVSFKRVNDLGMFLMAESCPNLESIRFGGFSRITDAGCRAVLHSCLKLHTFELSNTPQLTDLAFHDLRATPLGLERVALASCGLLSDYSVRHLAYCAKLTSLNLKGCKSVGDAGLKAISCLSKLEVLALNGADLGDEGLAVLGEGVTPLVTLSLRGCQRITDDGVAALLAGGLVDTLESLDLSGIAALTDNVTLAMVRSQMHILELRFRDCPLIGDTTVIALASAQMKDRGFGATLRLLDLWNCRKVSPVALGWLKKPYFPKVRWVGLGLGRNLRLEVLEALAKTRPSVHIYWNGAELGHMFQGDYDEFHNYHARSHEEEDELERWLQDEEEEYPTNFMHEEDDAMNMIQD